MELDVRQLLNLMAIARHGSFSRAAAERRLSQPALSNSIRQLEGRLRAPVLTRGRQGATLTDLGRMLVRHEELLEIQLGRATQELAVCGKTRQRQGRMIHFPM